MIEEEINTYTIRQKEMDLLMEHKEKVEERRQELVGTNNISLAALLEANKTGQNIHLVGETGKTISCAERRIINSNASPRKIRFGYFVDRTIYPEDEITDKLRNKAIKIILEISHDTMYFIECDHHNCKSQSPYGESNEKCPIRIQVMQLEEDLVYIRRRYKNLLAAATQSIVLREKEVIE